MSESIALNCDCLEYMRTLPDNYFDLCVADPPYGDACSQFVNVERERERDGAAQDTDKERMSDGQTAHGDMPSGVRWNRFGQRFDRYKFLPNQAGGWHGKDKYHTGQQDGRNVGEEVRKKIIAWDVAPGKEYFDEIFRVSRNQVIWGGNYFGLPPTRCFLVWRKLSISESFSMAMAEYAWTSFNSNAKVFEAAPQGKVNDPRFHPTQKPVELYTWVYNLLAKKGDKVFDPYLGSGSSRIAAYSAGFDFVGCEIDPIYFEKQEERFERHTAQISLF